MSDYAERTAPDAPRSRFFRAPSVEDYERMSQRLRLLVAEEIAASIHEAEQRKEARRLASIPPPDPAPDVVREEAERLLRRYQDKYREDPIIGARRLARLNREAQHKSPCRPEQVAS